MGLAVPPSRDAFQQVVPYQGRPGQGCQAEPPDPPVVPPQVGLEDPVQRQASPLASHEIESLNGFNPSPTCPLSLRLPATSLDLCRTLSTTLHLYAPTRPSLAAVMDDFRRPWISRPLPDLDFLQGFGIGWTESLSRETGGS